MASGSYARKPLLRAPDETQLLTPVKARATATQELNTIADEIDDTYGPSTDTYTFSPLPTSTHLPASQTTLRNRTTRTSSTSTSRIIGTDQMTSTGPVKVVSTNTTRIASTGPVKATDTRTARDVSTGPVKVASANTTRIVGSSPVKMAGQARNPTASRIVDLDRVLRHDIPVARPTAQQTLWQKPWVICLVLVVTSLMVLITAGIFQRSSDHVNLSMGGGQTYSIQVGGAQAGQWQVKEQMPIKKPIPTQSGPYGVLGKPSLNVNFMNQVLAAYHSPAAGKGQALYDMGVKYGIDPAFALAFFMHESSFGTQGEARVSKSLGNLRCIPNFKCQDGYAWFNSWEDGFQAWYELIRNLYVAGWGLTTVDQIIPRYAPAADNNDEQAYINSLKHELDTWHAGQTVVA